MCVSHPVPGSAVRLTDWAEPEPSSAGCLHTATLLHFLTIALSIPLFLPPSLPPSRAPLLPSSLLGFSFLSSSLRIFRTDFFTLSFFLPECLPSFLPPFSLPPSLFLFLPPLPSDAHFLPSSFSSFLLLPDFFPSLFPFLG